MRTTSVVAGLLVGLAIPLGNAELVHADPVVVTVTFDDTLHSQLLAVPMLAKRGMPATWYVNSNRIGGSTKLSLAELRSLQADGHEIGGHTIAHQNLTTLTESQMRHAVCDDRRALWSMHLYARTFAYPFGAYNATARRVVAQCYYHSARAVGGIYGPPYAESVPPRDRFAIRSVGVHNTSLPSSLLAVVDRARRNGGGWLPFRFHEVCWDDLTTACPTLGMRKSRFDTFLHGLAIRGVRVRTVGAVVP